jgi:uncharacterized BrkB/YihY/UPF0761 family membrane protein
MRRFAAALALTFRYWMQTEVHVFAFSVAANVLLSFYPFLIVMISLSRIFFDRHTTIDAVNLALSDYFPDALRQFLLRNLPQQVSTQVVSTVLLLFTANGIFEPLEIGLNHVWGIRTNRSFFRNQLVSLALIFTCGCLALLSLMLTALNHRSMSNPATAWVPVVFFKLAALPIAVLVLFLVYRFLPNGRPPLNRVILAAIAVGVLMEVLKYASKLMWPWFQRRLEREYNIFQNSVGLVFLGFLVSMLVLAGAEWAARGHRLDAIPEENANA